MQCKIAKIKAQSVRNKDILLTQEIVNNNIDVTLITDTWLKDTPQDTAWLHQSDLLPSRLCHLLPTTDLPGEVD